MLLYNSRFSNLMHKLITIIILFVTTISISIIISSTNFDFSYAQQIQDQQTRSDQIANSDHYQNIDDNIFTTLRGANAVLSLSNNQTWPAGPDMTYIDTTNDGRTIIASSGDNHIYVFNKDNIGDSSELIAKIKVGEKPRGVKISPDEKYVLVANEVSGTISIIDFKNMSIIKEVQVGKIPHNIVFSTDYKNKKLAYITLQGDDKVITMNMTSFDKVGEIIVNKGPHNLDITPDGKYLFVANAGSSDVAVIDIASKQVIKKIPVSTGHHGIDVSPNGKMVYASGIGSDKVNVIDPVKLELVKQIKVGNGPHGIRTNSVGKLLYVEITSTNKVVLIDTEQLKIIDYINTGKTPFWIAIPNNS